MEGIVVKFDEKRGFGFIRTKKLPEDVFVHVKNVQDRQNLLLGQTVQFKTEETPKGLSALKVVPGKKQTSPYFLYGMVAAIITVAMTFFLYETIFSYKQNWQHIIIAYIASVNLTTLLFYGYDKMIAGGSILRVPEWILHGLSICGGSPAGLIAQKMFHHKTIKGSFQMVYWMIVIIQVVILVWYTYNLLV